MYPEIVRLGQRELDEVLGGERLPDFSDMPRLPYISAIAKEVLRWRPPTPFGASSRNVIPCVYGARLDPGAPHRLMEDDVYRGQFIPAGAMVTGNVWCVAGFVIPSWRPVEHRKGRCSVMSRCILTHTSSTLADSSRTVKLILRSRIRGG